MTVPDEDRDLADRFARLRQRERATAPGFDALVSRRPQGSERPERRRPWIPALVPVGIVLILGIAVSVRASRTREATGAPALGDPSALIWRGPTDFLLQTPGREMLRTVPVIGDPNAWSGALAPGSPGSDSSSKRRTSS